MNNLIGSRLKRNVFNSTGSFLLPVNTVLNEEHIEKLKQNNIILKDEDIVSYSLQDEDKLLNESLVKVKEFFQIANFSKTIPLFEIRRDIIPAIQHISRNRNLFNLLNELHEKDDYTYTHNLAVAVLATNVGRWLKLNNNDIQTLTLAALLHDIGNTKIENNIISKQEKLSGQELEEYKKHTIYGYEIIKKTVGASERIALVALQHHEYEDGTGYPHGLRGNEIDLFSKIVAICDTFHTMISKENKPFFIVLKEMWNDSFTKLDVNIMSTFNKKIMESTIGNSVILSDGSEGTVVMLNPYDPIYPLVKLEDEEIINLSTNRSVYLEKIIN